MDIELRELLDAVEVQLAEGEERLASAREIVSAEGLDAELAFTLVFDDEGENQDDYSPEWAEPLAEPFFIPEGRNELDALFDAIDENARGIIVEGFSPFSIWPLGDEE